MTAAQTEMDSDDRPVDVQAGTGRLLSVAELRRALQLIREGTVTAAPVTAAPAATPEAAGDGGLGLPLVTVPGDAAGYIVGASGGAGESLLADLLTAQTAGRYIATGHRWPAPDDWVRVVLCARTNLASLTAAQKAIGQWGTGRLHGVDLVGMALLADAPGKEPRPISQFVQVLAGGVPRQWRIPWIGDWRLGPPEPDQIPKNVQAVLADIRSTLATPSSTN